MPRIFKTIPVGLTGCFKINGHLYELNAPTQVLVKDLIARVWILFFFFFTVAQSCLTFCDPMDFSSPGSSDHGILLTRKLEWEVIPFSRGSSLPRDPIHVSFIAGDFLPSELPGKPRVWNTQRIKIQKSGV